MFRRILVPLDGSQRSERALPIAARIARATQGSLLLVRVVHSPSDVAVYGAEPALAVEPSSFEKHLADANRYLQMVIETYTHELEGLHVMTDVESGGISSAIFTAARLEHVDLIVLCHYGETGLMRWIFQSVAQQAVRHSPVLLLALNVHATMPPVSDPMHIWRALVPLDGSELAECALEPAAHLMTALASPGQAELHLLSVVDSHTISGNSSALASPLSTEMPEQARKGAELYLERVMRQVQQGPLASLPLTLSTSTVISSDVPAAILRHTNQEPSIEVGYDLIAMATHGRSGVRRLLMGSVTEHLLGTTMHPMLVVRPTEVSAPSVPSAFVESAHS